MEYPITATLNEARAHAPCRYGWKDALKAFRKTKAPDEPITFAEIVEAIGVGQTLWLCRFKPEYESAWQFLIAWCLDPIRYDEAWMDPLFFYTFENDGEGLEAAAYELLSHKPELTDEFSSLFLNIVNTGKIKND